MTIWSFFKALTEVVKVTAPSPTPSPPPVTIVSEPTLFKRLAVPPRMVSESPVVTQIVTFNTSMAVIAAEAPITHVAVPDSVTSASSLSVTQVPIRES